MWFWAAFGVAIVTLATTSWLRWLASGDFVRPDPGSDPYAYMAVLRGTEFLSSSLFLYLFWYTLIRPWYRDRILNLDGKLFIGGFFASTLDVLFASFNPTWAMNAHAISFGTWSNFFPGYPSPATNEVAWGLLWCLPAYIWLGVGAAILGCGILDRLRNRYPAKSEVTMYIIVLLIFMASFFILATVWNRTGVYTYVSTPKALTLWYGKTYQIPIYEPLFIAAYCLSYTWLRDSLDSNGRCAVDRDLARLHFRTWMKNLTSTLAVCGFAAVTTLVAYQIPFSWLSMTGDSHPQLPSYLQPGLYCGQPGKPLCAGQYLKKMREEYDKFNPR